MPPLDDTPVNRPDRTIKNGQDNYAVTFLKTYLETNGAYELVQVELAPKGGNDWHYHKDFVEKFHVLQGNLTVGLDGKEIVLKENERLEAPAKTMHKFYNTSGKRAVFTVEINPGRNFEKTLRAAYGLCNDGHCNEQGPTNPWHLILILGYSESFLPMLPGFIQEPLIPALAKIAQWKGEHKALEVYYR